MYIYYTSESKARTEHFKNKNDISQISPIQKYSQLEKCTYMQVLNGFKNKGK
jgi:hypothetical protein